MKPILEKRWQLLARRYCQDDALIATYWYEIKTLHGESHRYYHTLTHLQHIFQDIDKAGVVNDAVEFAIWYHDSIYKPGSIRNEAKSAALAKKRLKVLGVTKATIDRVIYMINCTKKHKNPKEDKEAQFFLDADMAILGADQDVYNHYLEKLAREFSIIPKRLYKKGRIGFIESTLKQPVIFTSDFFFEHYEAKARNNLSQELNDRIQQ